MDYENPHDYKEFEISAYTIELKDGMWRGSHIIKKGGEIVHRASNAASFPSSHEAEQQSLSIARRVINGDVAGLTL